MRWISGRAIAVLVVGLVVVGSVACGDGASVPATKTGGGKPVGDAGGGSLIIAKPNGFVEYDIKAGSEKPLITAESANTFLLDPAVSPDGKRIAYVVQPPPKVEGNKYDAGSDLWVANRDGSDQHVVFTHVQPNQLIRFPQWSGNDGILAIVQEIATKDGITSVVYTLERADAESGERTKVLENVLAFALSPDGKQLVYAKLAPGAGETFESQDITGANPRTLVPITQNLTPFNSPRYSPDGAMIAFASADQTGARAHLEYVTLRAGSGMLPNVERLDGLPEDIWTIEAAGSAPVRIADLKEDLPSLTWNGDGKHIFVLGSAGLYDVNVASGAVNRLGEGVFHGGIVWVR